MTVVCLNSLTTFAPPIQLHRIWLTIRPKLDCYRSLIRNGICLSPSIRYQFNDLQWCSSTVKHLKQTIYVYMRLFRAAQLFSTIVIPHVHIVRLCTTAHVFARCVGNSCMSCFACWISQQLLYCRRQKTNVHYNFVEIAPGCRFDHMVILMLATDVCSGRLPH